VRLELVMLESQTVVRRQEREEFAREYTSSEKLWSVQLSALTMRNSQIEADNIKFKEAIQCFKISDISKDAKMTVLTDSLKALQSEFTALENQINLSELKLKEMKINEVTSGIYIYTCMKYISVYTNIYIYLYIYMYIYMHIYINE
jgi:hypothetical protein